MPPFKPEDYARLLGVMNTDAHKAVLEEHLQDMLRHDRLTATEINAQRYAQAQVDARTQYSSLEAFAAAELAPQIKAHLTGMVAGRALRGLPEPQFSIKADVQVELDAWNNSAKMHFRAKVLTPREQAKGGFAFGPGPLTATAMLQVKGVDNIDQITHAVLTNEALPKMAQDLAATLALRVLLPESAMRLVEVVAAPTLLNEERGYRTKVKVAAMEWFEPEGKFPSEGLVGRILALA